MKKIVSLVFILICIMALFSGCVKSEASWLKEIAALESTDAAKALSSVQEMTAKYPKSIDGWHTYARIASNLKKFPEALVAYRALLAMDPQNMELGRKAAQAAIAAADSDSAIQILSAFLSSDAIADADFLLLYEAYNLKKDYAECHKLYADLEYGDLSEASLERLMELEALAYVAEGDMNAAADIADRAYYTFDTDEMTFIKRLSIHLSMDPQKDGSVSDYSDLMKEMSDDTRAAFVKNALNDLKLLEAAGADTTNYPKIIELLTGEYTLKQFDMTAPSASIGNEFHSSAIGDFGNRALIMHPSGSGYYLMDEKAGLSGGGIDAEKLSSDFDYLFMNNIVFTGQEFVTSDFDNLCLTGISENQNLFTRIIAEISANDVYIDGKTLVVVTDNQDVMTISLETSELKNLNLQLDYNTVLGIYAHQLVYFKSDTNSILLADLATGNVKTLLSDERLTHVLDFDGTSIYVVDYMPEDHLVDSNASSGFELVEDIYRIDVASGSIEFVAKTSTQNFTVTSSDTFFTEYTSSDTNTIMAGGQNLYLVNDDGQIYCIKKDGTGFTALSDGSTDSGFEPYGITSNAVYFKAPGSGNIKYIALNDPSHTFKSVNFQ